MRAFWLCLLRSLVLVLLAPAVPSHAGTLALTWTDNSANEDGFVVERSSEAIMLLAEIGRVGPDVIGYNDVTAIDGVTYWYRARAFNAAGLSTPSNVECKTAPATPPLPALALDVAAPMPTMIVTATFAPGTQPMLVDAYIVLQAPDGSLFSVIAANTLVPGVFPAARQFLPMPFFGEVFRYAFTGGEPDGTYQWFAALTEAGTPNLVGALVQIPLVK